MVRPRRVKAAVTKGKWTEEEDEVLRRHVEENGATNWSSIQSNGLLPRTGKSCRLRWVNKLRPGLRGCKFSSEEERVVIDLQAIIGNKWAEISTYLPGRTDNDVKNFWSTRKKKLARMMRAAPPPSCRRSGNNNSFSSSSHVLQTSRESCSGTMIPIQETRYHIGESSQQASMVMTPFEETTHLIGESSQQQQWSSGKQICFSSSSDALTESIIPIQETMYHIGESSQQASMRCFSSSSYALHTSTGSYSESSQQLMIPFQEATHYQIGESSSQQQPSMENNQCYADTPFHGLVPSPDDSLFAMVPVYYPAVFTDMVASAADGFGDNNVANYLQEPVLSEVQPIQFFGPEDDGYGHVGLLHPAMSHMVFDEMSPEMLHCFDLPPPSLPPPIPLPPPPPPPPPSTQL